jgi:ketosteroid isomerase-like protein
MNHPNEDLLRAAYGMRNQGEVSGTRYLFRDDVVWHTLSGVVHGVDEVLAMLAGSDEMAAGSISREVHALLANDEYGMVLVTVRAARQDRRFEDRQVHVYRFRDGKIAEFWLFPGDRESYEEFWS